MSNPEALLGNVPDMTGCMIIQDGMVVHKSGEMENDDSLANHFIKLVNVGTSDQIIPGERFQTINVNYIEECTYTVAVAGTKIYIIKRGPMTHNEIDQIPSTFPVKNIQ